MLQKKVVQNSTQNTIAKLPYTMKRKLENLEPLSINSYNIIYCKKLLEWLIFIRVYNLTKSKVYYKTSYEP